MIPLLIPSVAWQTPTKIPSHSVSYIQLIKPVEQPRFPDRTKQALEAQQQRALEAAQAAEAQRLADIAAQQVQAVYTAPISYCNDAKSCIYSKESGNDPGRWNDSGCVGLGQACPASKLLAVCPNLDYACEDAWFTNYMLQRYGSWEAAWAFWQRTDARPYPGNWW